MTKLEVAKSGLEEEMMVMTIAQVSPEPYFMILFAHQAIVIRVLMLNF